MEVIWSNLAHSSLLSVLAYVSQKFGQRKSYGVYKDIKLFVATLGGMPRMGKVVGVWSQYGEIRKVIHKQDSIYYHLKDGKLVVIVVWDTRQSPLRLEDMIVRYFTAMELDGR